MVLRLELNTDGRGCRGPRPRPPLKLCCSRGCGCKEVRGAVATAAAAAATAAAWGSAACRDEEEEMEEEDEVADEV